MCDPEMSDQEARDALIRNQVDYDSRCGKTRTELLLEYCKQGSIREHVILVPLKEAGTASLPTVSVEANA